MKPTNESRFRGCMLGGAVGDALGAPVEFQSLSAIIKQCGKDGVTDYLPAYGGIGRFTDDTQMALFTAEGMLKALAKHDQPTVADFEYQNALAQLRWLHTQKGQNTSPMMSEALSEPDTLLQHKGLFSSRAPGGTCLSALRSATDTKPARNDSKGCGTVMRMAPVGLFCWKAYPELAFTLANSFGALTHGHPTGYLAGGYLADLIVKLLNGYDLFAAVLDLRDKLSFEPESEELYAIMLKAEKLAFSGLEPRKAIKLLGEGWIAEEALAIAVYCALVAQDFREGVLMAVNHDGDTDSTGSIAGNILGILYGVESIPQDWLDRLEMKDVIETMADNLLKVGNE
ncbi:ADP-ribosylglycohydrolase family protein [Salmonella enterica]|nr:ADP-ribosylglycohydrolase family protein [Salmonella enterica]